MSQQSSEEQTKGPLAEISQPFIDLMHAPRALWGINLAYLLEGMVYFGMLGYLAMHFSDFVFQGMDPKAADVSSHHMVMVLTAGITISMFVLGFVADKYGVRPALIGAFCLMLCGRVLISGAPFIGMKADGLWTPLHLTTMGGILLVVVGYGMYQPAAYAGVRQFTSEKTAAMGFAMLYALMNLGGWLPSGAFLLRSDKYLGLGIQGTYWIYTFFTLIALFWTFAVLSPGTVSEAIARAKEEREQEEQEKKNKGENKEDVKEEKDHAADPDREHIPLHLWGFAIALCAFLWVFLRTAAPWHNIVPGILGAVWILAALIPVARRWLARHPLSDAKFSFFIFALIPVQTLFAYNWLILPQYINRAYSGWIGEKFEIAANFNPLLIFILVPMVTALTQKRKVYNMMILGTFVMAAPAFLLALGTNGITLFAYLLIMTVGEAMWQPRFLQYAAEIAPEGRTGQYMGVAQLPWFLTKLLVPLYSGTMIARYCPAEGAQDPQAMWMIFGIVAMSSTVMLVLAKGWVGKGFKTKA